MAKIRVTVIREFEIPDTWTFYTREEDDAPFLLIDGESYWPNIQWFRRRIRKDDGSEEWEDAQEKMISYMADIVIQEKESIEEIDHFMYGEDEDEEQPSD